MIARNYLLPSTALVLSLGVSPAYPETPVKPTSSRPAMLDTWTGPFGGVPAWGKVKPADFPRAFEIAMDEQRAAIKKITQNPKPATFENTIAALERSSRLFDLVSTYFGVHTGTLSVGDMPKIEEELAPKLAAFSDEITQNSGLFKRVETVYKARTQSKLTAEQQRLTWVYYTGFVRGGAQLDAAQK